MDAIERVATLASLAVQHACAYGDLIADDMEAGYAAFGRRLWVGVVLVAAGVFSVALACVLAIAAAWDTVGRLWLIAVLFGVFALITLWAFVTLRRLVSAAPGMLARSGVEWQKDRLLLGDLLPAVGGETS